MYSEYSPSVVMMGVLSRPSFMVTLFFWWDNRIGWRPVATGASPLRQRFSASSAAWARIAAAKDAGSIMVVCATTP